MRIILLLVFFLTAAKMSFPQTKKPVTHQTSTTEIRSKTQLQSQMNEATTGIKNQIADLETQLKAATNPDEKKSFQDQITMLKKQVAMMGGLTRNISNLSDKTIKEGIEQSDNNDAAPRKDITRINALPKKTLTSAELAVFVQKVNLAIDKKLPLNQKKYAKELYDEVNAKEKSPVETGNIAVLCWLAKSTDMAIWIMGKACMDDTSNTDNLSNYASFLSMVGGEQLAIPIQQNLLARFPNNTTLMNNLGQSWYGLGDLTNSKKYLGGAVMIMAAHPYAQETICGIEEAEGSSDESIESLKRSLEEDYTPEKEAKLEQQGYHVKYEDFKFKYPTKPSPIGIEKFLLNPPGYAFEGGEAADINRMEWEDYQQKIAAMVSALQQTRKDIDDRVEQYRQKLFGNLQSKNIKSYKDVDVAALAGRVNPLLQPYNNKVYKTARRKYELLVVWFTDRMVALDKKMKETAAIVEQLHNDYNVAIQNSKSCGASFAAATKFNSQANALWQQRNAEFLSLEKEFSNARANYSLYAALDPSIYEQDILTIKLEILGVLSSLKHENEVGCDPAKEIPKPAGKTLPDFDEMNCQYTTELSIKYKMLDFSKYFSIKIVCNKMTTKFDLKYVKGSLVENLAHGTYKGTVEIQGKIGSDKQQYGPIELGTQVKGGVGVDFTEGGIEDVYVSAKVGVKAGVAGDAGLDLSPSSDLGSLEGKMSLVTGKGSITGKGAFSGISIK